VRPRLRDDGDSGKRAADPPFPRFVALLGVRRPLVVDRQMPCAERWRILSVIRRAAAKLDAEHEAGLLTPADRACLGALRGFALGRGRSAQDRGVFIFGLADVRASEDPDYWTSALVHDGVHALLQSRGRPYRDEVAPCEAQIAYLTRTGGGAALIEAVRAFKDSRARQRTRWREAV
jgi:hypothetical protein